MRKKKLKITEKDIFSTYLPFERPIVELEKTILEMRTRHESGIDLSEEIESAEKTLEKEAKKVFEHLTPWQRVQVARHPLRPYTLDYIRYLTEGFLQLHGRSEQHTS